MTMADDDLRRAVGALPRSIEPPPEVWAGIEHRIRQRQRWRWALPLGLAAAAVAALGLSMSDPPDPSTLHPAIADLQVPLPTPAVATPTEAPVTDLIPAEAELRKASTELAQAFDARRSLLDESLLAVLDENLGVVDDAIERSRAALAAQPEDEHLRGVLDRAYRHKLALLRTAVGR